MLFVPTLRRRAGWTLLETITAVTALGTLLSAAMLVYSSYRARAYQRLCHAQQRSLQKQVDSLGPVNLDVPMVEIVVQLVNAGSLQGTVAPDGRTVQGIRLTDPGGGEGSYRNYYLMPGSRMVGCRTHRSAFLEEP